MHDSESTNRNPPGKDTDSHGSSAVEGISEVDLLAHDLRNYFYQLQMSIAALRAAREDEASFDEVIRLIQLDYDKALSRLKELIDMARQTSPATEEPASSTQGDHPEE